MLYTILSALCALIAACGGAYTWIRTYDITLRLDTVERRIQSVQGTLGQQSRDVGREAREAAAEAARDVVDEALDEVETGDEGGMDMESIMPLLMMGQGMGGGGPQGGAGQSLSEEEMKQVLDGDGKTTDDGDPSILGQGGTD